ncbi:Zinc finger C6HC type [Echinococcus multilocularis]|uniref:RBR-type E3 ubiquitin transferase n=1 Tax=Echinococcus multilocularis TaxID=6211 RepID=A0A068YLK0_ECHMU|nr:Zinc finger C6HC type [Echinococcus multilocularis]
MEVINNLLAGNQRRPRTDTSVISSSSGSIRYKWPHRRRRRKVQKSAEVESVPAAAAAVTLGVGSDTASVVLYPGLLRVPADDSCVVCANDVDSLYALQKCGHRACLDCWRAFVASQVSSFAMAHITCIACDCRLSRALTLQLLRPPHQSHSETSFTQNAYVAFLAGQQASAAKLYQRYEDFLLHQYLIHDKRTRWCPRGCGYAVLASHKFRSCPRIECSNSDCPNAAFCYKCRGPWSTDGCDHICHKPNTVASASVGGGTEGTNNLTDNHRSLLSRLQQLFRLSGAVAAPMDAAVVATVAGGGAQLKTEADTSGDSKESSGSQVRRLSGRRFSTPAIPVQAADAIGVNTDDEDDNGLVDQESDVDISKVELELPDNLNGQVKACPRCKTLLLKLDDGSCNHMSCFICGCEFCWLCLREVRDTHFLSPTGCTFWGRNRWPFRRRICAMLLAAFGTPFILAIVTALAMPGIAIGFPAYLVYKVGQNVKGRKWKRLLLKTLSFFGGLFVSPIIAGLVALFGIPLVLIYVYIFMPITLFSELKVRLSTDSTNAPDVDPEVGFKINWDRVGESASTSSSTVTASVDTLAPDDSPKTTKASKHAQVRSTKSLEVLHERAAEFDP